MNATLDKIDDFLDDYQDEYNHGDLYRGAESYSIRDVDSLLHDSEYQLPKALKARFQDIWDDRVDGQTLLGTDERTITDVAHIKNATQSLEHTA